MSDTFAKTVKDLTSATASQVSQALDQVSSLAESKQTEGQAGRDKLMLYLSLGGLALAAIAFFRK